MLKKYSFILLALLFSGCDNAQSYCELRIGKATKLLQEDKNLYLYKAIREEKFDKFKELIEIGANPNFYYRSETWDNRGGIMELAVMHHSNKFLKEALKNAGDPNALNRAETESLLFVAVGVNDLPKVKLLLDHGANINFRDSMDRTPFHKAIMSNSYSIALYLYKRKADIHTKYKFGYTPKETLKKYGELGAIRTEADRKALYELYRIFDIELDNNYQ